MYGDQTSGTTSRLWPAEALARHGALILYLIGLFGWVAAVPLYGAIGQAWTARAGATFASLPNWFLSGNLIGSILTGYFLDRRPERARFLAQTAVLLAALLTLLLFITQPAFWPILYVAMGLAASGTVAWGRWYALQVETGWLGRVFGLTAAGVSLVEWLTESVAHSLQPQSALLLTLLPLLVALLALWRFREQERPQRPFAAQSVPDGVRARTVVRFGLFIIFFSLVAGLSYRYMTTAHNPFIDDTLRRGPYIIGVLIAGGLADRRNLLTVMVFGAGTLALAFLLGAWSADSTLAYVSTGLNGTAFGLLESAPWLLLASNTTRTTAGRWFGWGLNLNIIPIILGSLIYGRLQILSPERLGLVAAVAILLAILSLHGVTDPLTVLHEYGEVPSQTPTPNSAAEIEADPAPAQPATPPVPVADLLTHHFGDVLSSRELEVGRLAILGIASRDIAQQMYISENTVKTHLRNLYRKTQTANRNDLYRKLVEGHASGTSAAR